VLGSHENREVTNKKLAELEHNSLDELKAIIVAYAAQLRTEDQLIALLKELARLRSAKRSVPSSAQRQALFPELADVDHRRA
jgi:aspartate oxidase